MRRTTLGIFLAVLAVALPGPVHAQGTATATYLSGKVEKAPGVQVKMGDVLKAGDRLTTGPRATVEIKLDDGSMVKLGEKTTAEVGNLARVAGGKKDSIFKVSLGKVRALVAHLAAGRDRFELQGPTAAAGASGSDLGADVSSEDETYFGFDGNLYSKGSDGKAEHLPVYGLVRYKGGKKIHGPSPMSRDDYADWEEMSFQTPGIARPSITSQAGVSEQDAVMLVIRELVDRYERRRITAFLSLWNDERFRAYNQLERDIESDFENYRDLRLNYKNARVTMAPGGRAIFEASWEKRYLIPGGLADEKQAGFMQLLLEKERGKWMVSGMSGERIFGSTGGLPDLTVTGLDLASKGSAGAFLRRGTSSAGLSRQTAIFPATSATVLQAQTITATVKALTRRRADNVTVRFFEGSSQIGSDQRVSVAGLGTAQASVAWTPGLPLGTRTIKAVVDPDERVADVNRSNNVGQRQVEVKASDAVLTVSPGTVTFPSGNGNATVTIRVVDLDQAGKGTVTVTLRSTYSAWNGNLCVSTTETETIILSETSTLGTFEVTLIPTQKASGATVTQNNGRFDFDTRCVASITVTVAYVEPMTSGGQTNVERTTTFTAN